MHSLVNSADIYERAVVKPALSLSKGRSGDFFAGIAANRQDCMARRDAGSAELRPDFICLFSASQHLCVRSPVAAEGPGLLSFRRAALWLFAEPGSDPRSGRGQALRGGRNPVPKAGCALLSLSDRIHGTFGLRRASLVYGPMTTYQIKNQISKIKNEKSEVSGGS
jgi:hypothetical protein